MTLYDTLLQIQYDNGLNTTEFIEKIGFSRGLYYSIKDGKKTELKPLQMKKIVEMFPGSEKYFNRTKETEKNNLDKKEIPQFNTLEELGDFVSENFEEIKNKSSLFSLTIINANQEYLIDKLTENGIQIKTG